MIFNMSTSYFHNISFHYFEDYLMTKLTLRWGRTTSNKQKEWLVVGSGRACFLCLTRPNPPVQTQLRGIILVHLEFGILIRFLQAYAWLWICKAPAVLFSLLLFLVPFSKPGAEHIVSSTRSIDQKQFII